MKLLAMATLTALLTSFSPVQSLAAQHRAGEREKQPSLLLKSREGVEIIIDYSNETTHGINTIGVDIHIEEISIFGNGASQLNGVDVYLNGHLIRIDCDGNHCHKRADNDLSHSLYSQSVFFLGYRSQPTVVPIFASFFTNGQTWLVDPIRNDSYFQLMVKNQPN